MTAVYHGGGLDAAIETFGGRRSSWMDLSTGINPNAYPVGQITPEAFQRLPGSGAEARLLEVAREYYRVPGHMDVIAMNGTQALIECLPALVSENKVSIVSPTYGEHSNVWRKSGREVSPVRNLCQLKEVSQQTVVVVNPNNPDCRIHHVADLVALADNASLLIVDEAFCDPVPCNSIVPEMPDNVVVLKSFGKFFGLAGLRLGFAICNPSLVETLRQRTGPWAVSGPALEIGAAALSDRTWIENAIDRLSDSSRQLALVLSDAGLKVVGENPLFVYVRHLEAAGIYEHLGNHQILVRPFPDNPEYLRFGLCKDRSQLRRLKNALESYADV